MDLTGPRPAPSAAVYRKQVQPPSWSRALLLVVVVVVVVGVLLASPLPAVARQVVIGIALVAGGVAVAASCRYRYLRTTGRRRVAFLLFALAALCGALSNLWQAVIGVEQDMDRTSPTQVALLLALVLGTAGLVAYRSLGRGPSDLVRMVLDGVVISGSLVLIVSETVLPQILRGENASGLARFASVAPALFDLMLATTTWLMWLRAAGRNRLPLALVSAGFASLTLSDLAGAVQSAGAPREFGTLVDLGSVAGYLLIAVGVRGSGGAAVPEENRPHQRSAAAGVMVLFGILLTATVVALSNPRGLAAPSGALLVLVLVAVAVRQTLLIIDNERFRHRLEQRVLERSSELREVTQRTDLLVDSVGDGVYGVDDRGLVTFLNPAAAQVLGYRARHMLGRDAHAVFHLHGEDGHHHAFADCYIAAVLREGRQVTSAEDVYLAQDGRHVPVEITASPLARDVRARGAVVVFRDVTQRREIDRLKNEFVSMVSHELKTPLTAIRGSLGLMAGGALGELAPAATRMVEIAMDSSERLTRMINQILDLERIESGTMPTQIGNYPARVLVDSAIEQVEVLAKAEGVTIAAGAREGIVAADADQVQQTLVNLLGNSIKFTPPGGVVEVESLESDGQVTFRVSDSGRGIPESDLESIFTRFHQVDSSDAREKGGTGLGLAISRSIVERLGGRIWAENVSTGGAVFRFTLPAAATTTPAAPLPFAVPDAVPAPAPSPTGEPHGSTPDPGVEPTASDLAAGPPAR